MIASGVLMAASVAGGIIQGAAKQKEGRKMQQAAQKQIDAFKWQELTNPYKNQQVSVLGADLRREEAATTEANMVDVLQNAGGRVMTGSIGKVQANSNNVDREISVNLDEQQKQIDRAFAAQEVSNQQIIEQRQNQELAGLGSQLNVGMGLKYQGGADIINGIGAAGQLGNLAMSQMNGATTTPDTSQMGGAQFLGPNPNYTGAIAYGVGKKANELVGAIQSSPDYAKVYGTSSFGMGQGMGFGLSL